MPTRIKKEGGFLPARRMTAALKAGGWVAATIAVGLIAFRCLCPRRYAVASGYARLYLRRRRRRAVVKGRESPAVSDKEEEADAEDVPP